MRYVFQLTTFMLFVLPMAVITALYIRIGLALRKAGNDRQLSTMSSSQGSPKRRRPIIKMLGEWLRERRGKRRMGAGTQSGMKDFLIPKEMRWGFIMDGV